ncbi:MAG TPA: hypothetical protein VHC20_05440 [Candidatus Paceibacterota bacterium]|nr:hypothetical protein [Candidatus Paceibacterota bacterium]
MTPERLALELGQMRKAADMVRATHETRLEFLRKVGLPVMNGNGQVVPERKATGSR